MNNLFINFYVIDRKIDFNKWNSWLKWLFIYIYILYIVYIVKPVLRGHLWDKEKVVFQERWPLKRGSIHMKFSMTGQKKVTF